MVSPGEATGRQSATAACAQRVLRGSLPAATRGVEGIVWPRPGSDLAMVAGRLWKFRLCAGRYGVVVPAHGRVGGAVARCRGAGRGCGARPIRAGDATTR